MNVKKWLTAIFIISFGLILIPNHSELMAKDSEGFHDKKSKFFIEYPFNDSLFPADIIAPTFRWQSKLEDITGWEIVLATSKGKPRIRVKIKQR